MCSSDLPGEKNVVPALQVQGSSVGAGSGEKTSGGSAKPGGKAGKVDWDFLSGLEGGASRGTPKEEDIARFLAKHGETPANLVVAFEIAKDRRWLDRALELFPKSPLVLMKAIEAAPNPPAKEGEKYAPDPERMALIEQIGRAHV